MSAKKKTKATASKKKSVPAKKTSKTVTGKKNTKTVGKKTTGKKTKTVALYKATGKIKAKAPVKKKTKRAAPKPKPAELITHGPDLQLIPVTGEIHPAGMDANHTQHEKFFHRHEEVALHQENMRAKQALASRKNIKRVFRNFRQS